MSQGLFDVAGKVVVVTGGTSGIGLMVARGFVDAGAHVYVSSRKREVCEEVERDLGSIGTCVAVPSISVEERHHNARRCPRRA